MVYDPTLLDQLEALEPRPWRGTVWRHMFADYPPDRPNTTGARWNPPETAAIYTSLDRSTAVAEGDHAVAMQPIRPRAKRTVYEVRVQVDAMLDLTDRDLLRAVGVDDAELTAIPSRACQTVGGATAWLERDGLLIPSARADGANLVIFVNLLDPDAEFEVVTSETISDG
jgi:RES domain-containing protein